MSAEKWAALDPETRAQVAEVIANGSPASTAQVIAAGLTAEQQPHATAIADAFERALDWHTLTPDERIGTAMTDAYRRGEDPVEVWHQWP